MDTKKIIWSVLGALLIFVAGAWLAILAQNMPKKAPAKEGINTSNAVETVKLLATPAVPEIFAYGQFEVSSRSGITISVNGQSIEIPTAKVVDISSLVQEKNGLTTKKIKSDDLKRGDSLRISLSIGKDGKISGTAILAYPPQGK